MRLVLSFLCLSMACHGESPVPVVELRENFRAGPLRAVEAGFVEITGKSSRGGLVEIAVTLGTGGTTKTWANVEGGRFSCRYPEDFLGAPALAPGMLYVDAGAGKDLLKERAEGMFIVTGRDRSSWPDLPAAFTDDFLDAKGGKDSTAVSWPIHVSLVNRFMRSRGAALARIGRADFDLAADKDFSRFQHMATLYDFDHRDRDWSTPLNHRVARAFWQAEWDRWFNVGNDHPWDGNKDNRSPENFRPYTFTNDLADLLILHHMRRSLPRAVADNRDAMCDEALANLLALQHRGPENFARPEEGRRMEHYTAGAFRYGFFESGEWLEEGTGWFVNAEAGDHRHGGVFNGRSAWALGESIKRDPSGPLAKEAADALALTLRYCLHDGLVRKYTKTVGEGLPFWRQAGEHGYLTLGMLAAAEVMPALPVTLDPAHPAVPLKEITVNALDALVAAVNAEGYWTKYPDQDAMGLAALAEGALLFPDHPRAAAWRATAVRAADGWLAAKADPAEGADGCFHFGRREGSRMTYYLGDKPEVHINLYITGLWLHALAKSYQLTGDPAYRARVEGMLAYLCGDNPFHARLLNELGAVFNIIRDTGGADSRLNWDCYPESTAFVQIGLLHWLDALHTKP